MGEWGDGGITTEKKGEEKGGEGYNTGERGWGAVGSLVEWWGLITEGRGQGGLYNQDKNSCYKQQQVIRMILVMDVYT